MRCALPSCDAAYILQTLIGVTVLGYANQLVEIEAVAVAGRTTEPVAGSGV